MSKLTKAELVKLVKESNKDLIDEIFTQPYFNDEVIAARNQKLVAYKKYVNTCLESLKSMVDDVNMQYTNSNLQQADIEFLIKDQLGRLRDSVSYTVSSLEAIMSKEGLQLDPAGAQFPQMMEEKKNK
tara:strand:- start:518 stop:901 length:384 start_codon:yes stop_codon:yes gene_type:complete